MAYQIDFTGGIYRRRRWKKILLRLLLVALAAEVSWGLYVGISVYFSPILDTRLGNYELQSIKIEQMDGMWKKSEEEYNRLLKYFGLVWAGSAVDFMANAAAVDNMGLGAGYRPLRWTLNTGGKCSLEYSYAFQAGDKAGQSAKIKGEMEKAISSAAGTAIGNGDVKGENIQTSGILTSNLLDVADFKITTGFSLKGARPFPQKEKALSDCVKEIAELKRQVQQIKVKYKDDGRDVESTALKLMEEYLATIPGKKDMKLPAATNVVSVAGFFDNVDKAVEEYGKKNNKRELPNKEKRLVYRAAWDKIGKAQYPWGRLKSLDNEKLVRRIKELSNVAGEVERYKSVLQKRHTDYLKRLEPLIDVYEAADVGNKPLIGTDLTNRVCTACGVFDAKVEFAVAPDSVLGGLEKEDNDFVFSLVRWKLSFDGPLALAKVVDCAKRAVALGPGYRIEKAVIDFGEGGNVTRAVLEGFLPVKTTKRKSPDKPDSAREGGTK